jgi:hypothetical protein
LGGSRKRIFLFRHERVSPRRARRRCPLRGSHREQARLDRSYYRSTPPGEAPLWVRQKWVGLDLPVARYSGQGRFLGLGVLSMPRSWLGQWLTVLRGGADLVAGYAVEAIPAVGILGEKSPEAAVWWRENTPHLIAPKRYLIFHEEVCRIADI